MSPVPARTLTGALLVWFTLQGVLTAQIPPLPGPLPGDGSTVEADADDPPPPRRRRRGRGAAPQAAPTPPPEAEEKKEVEEEKWSAIVGGTVHTVTDGVIEGATILVKDGRIHDIGVGLPVPPGAEVLAADGRHVYPGLVAVDSSGLVSSPTESDPYSFSILLALAGGVTTARAGGDVVKLTHGTLEGHGLAKSPFVGVSYSSRNPKGRREFREALERVREYTRAKARYERDKADDPELKEPDRKWIRGTYQTAERLITGSAVALARVAEATEIRALCDLAERFGFALVLEGAEEGWLVATEIARADAMVIVTPRARRDRDERRVAPSGGTIENAAILHRHGVTIAVFPVGSLFAPGGGVSLSGLAGRDLLNLPLEAAFAVRGGVPEEAAVRAITIDAARILGVDDRVGSIEVGKDADLIVTDGELLHYLTHVHHAIVNGRVAYDREAEGILDHIRKGGDPDGAPPTETWPRRLGEPF